MGYSRLRALAAVALLALPLVACATAEAPMSYNPSNAPRPLAAVRPVVVVGPVTDERTDGQANTAQYGTIRGGYGNPLRRLAATAPIREVVAQAFRDALAVRGLLAPGEGGGIELRVRITQYNGSKLLRSEANVAFQGSLVNRATGAVIWTGEGRSDLLENGNLFVAGIVADPEELRGTTLRAMAAAIDAMLDRPDFAAALR